MAKFYEPLPYEVEVDGRIIKLTPAFDNVLNMYEVLEDNLTDYERLDLMLYYLTENAPRDFAVLEKVALALFPESKKPKSNRSFDFIQDSDLICAAFWQTYGIDLFEEQGRLHWLKFTALLNGLPSNTRFADVINIRTREIPKPTKTNAKERAELLRLKSEFALKISDAERQKNLQDGLRKMASALLSMAKK